MAYRFTYETKSPGQTLVRRTRGEGHTFRDLVRALAVEGDGTIVVEEDAVPEKSLLRRIEGRDCRSLGR